MVPGIVLRSSFLLVLTITVFAFPSGVWSESKTIYIECPISIEPGIGIFEGAVPEGWRSSGAIAIWPAKDLALLDSRELQVIGSKRHLICNYVFKFHLQKFTNPETTHLKLIQNEPKGMTCEEYEAPLPKNAPYKLKMSQNKFKCESNNKLEIPGVTPKVPIEPTK